MKIKSLNVVLISLLGLLVVACSDSDEPVTPTRYRISWIYSDNSHQLFDYDSSGCISEWKYEDVTQNPSDVYRATYEYPEAEMVEIKAEEKRGDDIWVFNEKLYLNQFGEANLATGNVTISDKDGLLLMKKNYSANFHYNSSHQLERIDVTEKRINDAGQEEADGLEWFIKLEWKDGNLAKYSEYSNPEKVLFSKTFSYYEGVKAHYFPIVQGPILRHYYLPLQYQGLLGVQSDVLVKETEYTSNKMNYTATFSYDLSSSVHNSTVWGYYENIRGKETKYTIGWDNK